MMMIGKPTGGTFSKPRTTKHRVAWDYMTPDGRKGSWSQRKDDYLANRKSKNFFVK